jgi:hypothetical protein
MEAEPNDDDLIIVGGSNVKGVLKAAINCAMHGFQNIETLHTVLDNIIRHDIWKYASTSRRGALGEYKGFWDWATFRLPDGMGITDPERLIKMMEPWPETQRRLMDLWVGKAKEPPVKGGPSINPTGRRGKTDEEGTIGATPIVLTNTKSAEGILARLKRDHPEIAKAFIEGEYPSAAAAGRAAGIPWLQKPSPLEQAQKAFRRLTKEDRDAFDSWRGGLEL